MKTMTGTLALLVGVFLGDARIGGITRPGARGRLGAAAPGDVDSFRKTIEPIS